MSQAKRLVKILEMKIANITSQKAQLDDYVQKMISKARETLQTKEQDVNTLRDVNLTMDIVLSYFVDITSCLDGATDQESTEASSSPSSLLSSSLPQLPSATLSKKSHDYAESQEISKLQNRMEVLELAVSVCRNEIGQANTEKNEVRDKVDKLEHHIQKVETSHSHELDQKEERLTSLEKLTQQTQSTMTKEIKDLQKTFKDNIKRTKQELNTKMDHIDEEFQKTQEQNMATIKEQASKLSKVEKKLKKMKEEEQERWSQIDSIHQNVERYVAQHERDENRRREVEDRVAVVEAQRLQDLDHYTKELEETNSLYKAVCQLVDQRVTPLRRLQRMLNDYHKQVEKREEISARLDDVTKNMQDISTRLDYNEERVEELEVKNQEDMDRYVKNLGDTNSQLDDVAQKVGDISLQLEKSERFVLPGNVGFTAYYPNGRTPVARQGSRITDLTDVWCNEGNHYDPLTGEFICPIDGLYLVSATLSQWEDGGVGVDIKRQCSDTATSSTEVCRVKTGQSKTSSCGVAVIRLKTGEKVYVEVRYKEGKPVLSGYSSFSCVLIT